MEKRLPAWMRKQIAYIEVKRAVRKRLPGWMYVMAPVAVAICVVFAITRKDIANPPTPDYTVEQTDYSVYRVTSNRLSDTTMPIINFVPGDVLKDLPRGHKIIVSVRENTSQLTWLVITDGTER